MVWLIKRFYSACPTSVYRDRNQLFRPCVRLDCGWKIWSKYAPEGEVAYFPGLFQEVWPWKVAYVRQG